MTRRQSFRLVAGLRQHVGPFVPNMQPMRTVQILLLDVAGICRRPCRVDDEVSPVRWKCLQA